MFNMYNRRYTGSKYKLMEWIRSLIIDNCNGKTFFDVFVGTGVVTEYMINDYQKYIINDYLYSNEFIYKGFLSQENYDCFFENKDIIEDNIRNLKFKWERLDNKKAS